jgi:cysteinyl-tRNA synthetase
MDLRLYDTLTRDKRPFRPIRPNNVRMYVCGPTVYDLAHIGNARPVIVFDVLFRLLRYHYGEAHVTYVRNITDVDDKINDRAVRDFPGLPLNEAIRKVTEKTARQFHADVAALRCLSPTYEPRATDFVQPRADGRADMITMIEQLIARKHAYRAGSEVLFDTQSMPDYGALSARKLDEQRPGARVAVDAHKKNPLDFVLWKQSSDDEPGWESPWGRGRPGWHIECSAMSAAYLGDVFDIHGGGLDLIFPHHENEIAQSRCAHGTRTMANYWLHNEFVIVEGEKMSKSVGNFRTIADLREDWQGEVIRYQMLMAHYRQPLDWIESTSREAQLIVDRWYDFLKDFDDFDFDTRKEVDGQALKFLADDLNTHQVLARLGVLFEAAKKSSLAANVFVNTARLLGFLTQAADDYFAFYKEVGGAVPKSSPLVLDELLKVRNQARADKDFEKSDYLRNIIYLYGRRVVDGPNGDSTLVPAEKDFFSVSTNARARLSSAARVAMAQIETSQTPSTGSFKTGFVSKYGLIFNYTPQFNEALALAYVALDRDLGSGSVTEDDLRSALVDVVLTNRVKLAKFGPDVVAGAALFKLLSGTIRKFEAFFDNNIISVPEGIEWSVGSVAVVSSAKMHAAAAPTTDSILSPLHADDSSTSNFLVRTESSSSALDYRSTTLIRAFITATRLLMYHFDQSSIFIPPIGSNEQGIGQSAVTAMRLAKSDDGSYLRPGQRPLFPYKLSTEFVEKARALPLYAKLSRILSLELFRPISRELLTLDRLCLARSARDPSVRLFWNIEAVQTYFGVESPVGEHDLSEQSLSEVIGRGLQQQDLNPKDTKGILRQADRLARLRRKAAFVSQHEAVAAQHFAESLVLHMLASAEALRDE